MEYIIADKRKSEEYGINLMGTTSIGGKAVLSQHLLMHCSPNVPGNTLEEKAEAIDGEIVSLDELNSRLNN